MIYFRQRDRYSCGAVAFLNAFKWMGIRTSSRQLPSLKRILGTTVKHGTQVSRWAQVCRDAGFKRVYKPTVERLAAELTGGNALIVDTRHWNRKGGHAYLIIRCSARYFWCVNLIRGETISRISKQRMARRYLIEPVVYRVPPLVVGPNLIFNAPRAA